MLPVLLDPAKFKDAFITAKGEQRAHVALKALDTLWFNTGTLCNLTCRNCYIESSPLQRSAGLSDGSRSQRPTSTRSSEMATATRLIGFTGGEPFMNRELPAMLDDVLSRGLKAMVLTNAMKPMHKMKAALLGLLARHGRNLTVRVSVDHYGRDLHEEERGARSWKPTIDGLEWLGALGLRRPCRRAALLDRDRRRGARRLRPAVRTASACRSTRTIPERWCCSPRWIRRSTCRRSRRPAGAS